MTGTITTGTLAADGAELYYEVRGAGPLVVLVGAPMDADAFAPLADLLAGDHTVLSTDPRGVHRSPVADRDADSTPELRADDLSRLVAHVDAGPAAVFGSSGGAVSALAFAQAHPDRVRTVVAHEPPLTELLDDRDEHRRLTERMCATYLAGDVLGAWRMFFADAGIAMPPGAVEHMVGARDARQAATEDHWFDHEMRPTVYWRPDVAALRGARVVVGIGDDSAGQICDRTSRALAAALGVGPTMFPGGHTGFVDDPAAVAARLREVL